MIEEEWGVECNESDLLKNIISDSLEIMQFEMLIEKKWGIIVPLSQITETITVRQMLELINIKLRDDADIV